MKPVSTAVTTAIREDHEVFALPRLTAEFNMNRYVGLSVDNTPTEDTDGQDIEMFPIESIVEPIRPTKGIVKARVGASTVGDDYATNWRPRFYVSSVDDKYKYWSSPGPSDSAGNISRVAPHVIYDEPVAVNKIQVGLENTWASPSEFQVQVTTDGSSWSTVASNPAIDNYGRVVLYWNGTAWSVNLPEDFDAVTTVRGIRLVVTQLGPGKMVDGNTTYYLVKNSSSTGYMRYDTTGGNSYFELIEMSARRVVNLSDRLVEVSDTFDMGEESQLYPIGTITSNVGDIRLWNGDGYFDTENTASPLHKFLDGNVQLSLDYIYDVGGFIHEVPQFRMFSDVWTGQADDNVSVALADHSKFFQETTPNPMMWENLTVPEIVWRLCDSVGFVNYVNDVEDRAEQHVIPVFWTDGEQSLWEIFDELAKATQTAIYFDAYGYLQVKTRQTAFNEDQEKVWTLRGETSGTELADIVNLSRTDEFNTNVVKVVYQTTKWSAYNNGQPAMQVVWEPEEETQVLRASPLRATLETDQVFFRIPDTDAKLWPYKGMVNIQGELIRYEGKRFRYYTGSTATVVNYATVTSDADRDKYDQMTPTGYRHKNGFNGDMYISERGVWNSENKRHPVEAEGYSVRHIVNGTRRTDVYGFNHNRQQSKVTLNTGGRFKDNNDTLFVTRGAPLDTGFYYYGARFNFVRQSGKKDQTAGLLFHNNGANEDGYYVEFRASNKISSKIRTNRHEVLLYSRHNGKSYRVGKSRGAAIAIAENVEYDVDIRVGLDHTIDVWVNGRRVIGGQVPSNRRNDRGGKFGMFAKGQTKVQFEYLYAVNRDKTPPADDSSFLDRIRGEYRGYQWDREWVFDWKNLTRRQKKKSSRERLRWNQMYMDEFGPIVHEIREYDVKFDPNPVLHSKLYMSNDFNVVCTEYRADAFGAKIVIANTSRNNAVFHGEETLTYAGTDEAIGHVFTVLGRALIVSDGEEVERRNDAQVLRRGEVEAELTSKWIQSKEAAEEIADWISNHWGNGSEQVSVEIFGNPLIEIGDIVEVDFPRKNMFAATHRYFVTGTSSSFSNGITTNLTLRRMV